MERPTSYCTVIETFRGAQQKTQRHALSIRDVDVEFLHQSRREKPSSEAKARFGESKGRITEGLRPRLGDRYLPRE